jgi:purine-binding chemotaxis protein CheW
MPAGPGRRRADATPQEDGGMSLATQTATLALPGKYLSFSLAGRQYGLALRAIQVIAPISEVQRLPRTPARLRGVIRRRGRLVPVLDLRAPRDACGSAGDGQTSVIVVAAERDGQPSLLGVTVDEVAEVLSFTGEQIEAPPPQDLPLAADVTVAGVGRLGGRAIVLLDVSLLALSIGEELEVAP